MYYEINVSHNGHHLFATAKRSCTDSTSAKIVLKTLIRKFPRGEGYNLTVSYHPEQASMCEITASNEHRSDLIIDKF